MIVVHGVLCFSFVFSVSLCLCGEKALFPRSSTPVTITKDCLVPGKSLKPAPRQPICFSYGELNQQYSSQPRQRGRESGRPQASATDTAEKQSANFGHCHAEKYQRRQARRRRQVNLNPSPCTKKMEARANGPSSICRKSYRTATGSPSAPARGCTPPPTRSSRRCASTCRSPRRSCSWPR